MSTTSPVTHDARSEANHSVGPLVARVSTGMRKGLVGEREDHRFRWSGSIEG